MMKYGNLTLGQIEAIVNKLGGEEGVRKLLADELKVVPGSKVKEPDFLVRAGNYPAVELIKKHYPKKFYQTKEGLYVWPDFFDRIANIAQSTDVGKKFQKTTFWELKKPTTGEKLRQTHPDDVWSATDFCAWLSIMLTKQSKGQDGIFLNNGKANLFLVEGSDHAVFVVAVDWYSDAREWNVFTWGLGSEWDASHRFFSKPPIAL